MKVLRGEDEELRKISNIMFRARGFSHESDLNLSTARSAYSLQDHLEQFAIRSELLESRLALAGPMLESQGEKKASLRKQVSDGCVGAV